MGLIINQIKLGVRWWVVLLSKSYLNQKICYLISVASSNAADENDMNKARSLGKAACWVAIAGIIFTVVIAVILTILAFTTTLFWAKAVNDVVSAYSSDDTSNLYSSDDSSNFWN